MALDDDIRILSALPFFQGFTGDQLRLLAFGAERVALDAGRVLFQEGEAGDSAFVVLDGLIEVAGAGGPPAQARPGAMLGELALIAGAPRPASARAIRDSRLLRLARRDFRRMLEEYPDLAVLLHKRLTDEFQAMVERIERLAPRFS